MTPYKIETRDAFTVYAIGTQLSLGNHDFSAIFKEKRTFEKQLKDDGIQTKLDAGATSDLHYAINESYHHKMMYYLGVDADHALTDDEAGRLIEFPAGPYLVVPHAAADVDTLRNELSGTTFGDIIGRLEGYAYVGGPNAVAETGTNDQGLVTGEMLVPLVEQ